MRRLPRSYAIRLGWIVGASAILAAAYLYYLWSPGG